jgi:hypothetical protein
MLLAVSLCFMFVRTSWNLAAGLGLSRKFKGSVLTHAVVVLRTKPLRMHWFPAPFDCAFLDQLGLEMRGSVFTVAMVVLNTEPLRLMEFVASIY